MAFNTRRRWVGTKLKSQTGSQNARVCLAVVMAVSLTGTTLARGSEPFPVPLANPSFSEDASPEGIPSGWSCYGSGGENVKLEVVRQGSDGTLLISDSDPAAEIGVLQNFPLKGGETYEVTAKVRGVEGASGWGAYLQLRFLPSNKYVQAALSPKSADELSEVSVKGTAPPDTTRGTIYLYTHRDPTPQVLVTEVRLAGGLPAPPPPPPEPVPPQYDRLKDLHQQIPLVGDRKAASAIVVPAGDSTYRAAATQIQQAVETRTGVRLPILTDDDPGAAVPLRQNLILLGNRSTNQSLARLYDQYYCLVDLKYPGPKGYMIRTVHNPYGNGNSAVIVGGSDAEGVEKGARVLVGILSKATADRENSLPSEARGRAREERSHLKGDASDASTPPQPSPTFATLTGEGDLSLGWTMETELGEGVEPPTDIRKFETWEASRGYGSIGYFGWCSISKQMAMYYMTGNEACAREVVRLAFPDAQAIRDIEEIDGERIENKHDPLAGFYHYNAHMAILFWDLIEESPVFSDEERLRITNAFARQLNHRKGEGVYQLTRARTSVSSRHGQWAAISLYCLGRYFNKSYPDPVWAQCVRGGELAFGSLHHHAWLAGESDNLFWYCTGIAPVMTYMTLTGDRKPLENGVLEELLQGLDILISGREKDWALNSASLGMLNKAAYLTGDGRWLTYRERTGVDTDGFRLGQSFWPDSAFPATQPDDLIGKWTIQRLPEPAWAARASGLPPDQSFYFGSFRTAADDSGDYILLDGFNGASRNPYHTFDILQLRLGGQLVLDGYHNQVLTSADGMVEPAAAMDAALVHADVVGPTAFATGEVPKAAFCNWRRHLAQRAGCYALIVDDLTFRTDSQNMAVTTTWQLPGGRWDGKAQAVRTSEVDLRCCDVQEAGGRGTVTMRWTGGVQNGRHRIAFYLIAPRASESNGVPACLRVAENAAALALPEAALAVFGKYAQTSAELAVLAEDHLVGRALTTAGIDTQLLTSNAPVDIDWDFKTGVVHLVAEQESSVRMALETPALFLADTTAGRVQANDPVPDLVFDGPRMVLPPGRHVIRGAFPAKHPLAALAESLRGLFADGESARKEQLAEDGKAEQLPAADVPVAFTYQADAKVADITRLDDSGDVRLAVAAGQTIHLLDSAGGLVRTLETDGPIRVLRWWPETDLLLAGCVDEKVVAFDRTGKRTWTFTSEMDRAVYEAAKTYWFKSAPGHEGIHGLHTGVFDGGKSRCFVGSACTLEILDEEGQLVKRTPVFWGPGRKFLLLDRPDGSRDLLISRWLNGTDFLAVVNSSAMEVTSRGYYSVPSGHSFVSGWMAQNRTGLFLDDLDGNGTPEVATAINGTWNRVTVYSVKGDPLHNAQFGPGASSKPRSRMRDMDVADLNGDGKKEILVGLSEGLVVCLDPICERLWSTRLPSPPLSIKAVVSSTAGGNQVIVGCENGAVISLDPDGTPLRIGQVNGRPTEIISLKGDHASVVVLATEKGEVAGLNVAK